MKNAMILATGLVLVLSMPASAREVSQSGSSRWVVATGAASKDEAVSQAKEKVMALEQSHSAMPSDINVLLPANYIKGSFKIDGAKFYVSEYYDINGGPFFEVNALFDYTFKRKEKD